MNPDENNENNEVKQLVDEIESVKLAGAAGGCPEAPAPQESSNDEVERKLATIQTIKSITPIEGADRIVRVDFEGMLWVCVMKPEEAAVGLQVVYFEIDSLLPELPVFAFMADRKYHVKTCKFRGQISQGLALPATFFKEQLDKAGLVDLYDGLDLTSLLSITKFEQPEDADFHGPLCKGVFPPFISKTKEERAHNVRNLVDMLQEHDFHATVKLDGTSATYYLYNGDFGVCSRNLRLKYPPPEELQKRDAYSAMAQMYHIEERLRALGNNIALQGEIVGPGISANRYKLMHVQFYIFTAQNLRTAERLLPDELTALVAKLNAVLPGVKPKLAEAPSLGVIKAGTLKSFPDLIEFSNGPCQLTKALREGVVIRSLQTRTSFKVINPQYLIHHKL